jgi:topoisomerase-4 subunit A
MGVEGIAVGLASKVLPHNFIELIQGSIDVLKGKKTNLMPDFATGGVADFSNYKEGLRGGRIRIRAVIEKLDKKTLVIKQIPYGTTTTSVIESILAAVEKGKIKIKKVEDNTASEVEIVINLHPEASQDPDKAIEALYAFSNCEVSISPNSCIIEDGRPRFLSVNEILEISTRNTVDLLKLELEIARDEKETEWHYNSLEKIFIEKRIYRSLEVCETWDQIMDTIEAGLKPYLKNLRRPVVHDDYVRLTELKIKRISRYDANRAEEKLLAIEAELAEINDNLNNLKNYAINYFKELLKKFGKGRERRTVISSFETIVASKVIANNQKLYVNREEGFAGYGMKRDEFLRDCSDLDDVIAITGDGKFTVTRIAEKAYVGKDLRHIDIFTKNDETTTYNMIYQDGKGGPIMVKRFFISGITRDKVYDLTKGADGSKILYLGVSGPTNGPRVNVHLKPRPKLKNLVIEVDFNEQLTKNRSAIGNVLTKFPIAKLRVIGGGDPGTGTNTGSAPNPAVTPKPVTTAAAVKNTAESTDDTPKTGSNGKTQIKLEF